MEARPKREWTDARSFDLEPSGQPGQVETVAARADNAGAVLAREFSRVQSARSALALFLDWACIIAVAAASERLGRGWAWFAAIWLIGGRILGLTHLGHEAVHGRLFGSRSWNRWLGDLLTQAPALYTLHEFREQHLQHHRLLGSPTRDPIRLYIDGFKLRDNDSLKRRVWVIFARPLLGDGVRQFAQHIAGSAWRRPFALALWLAALTGFGLTHHLDWFFLYWVVPLFVAEPVLEMWQAFSDHYETQDLTRDTRGLFSIVFTHPHNNGYHWVHHKYPGIFWGSLPAATKALAPPGLEVSRGVRGMVRALLFARSDART